MLSIERRLIKSLHEQLILHFEADIGHPLA